ncbi:hypothetical protein SAMN04487827_2307 [Prevotella sp. khp7]|uniref:hypothetical protein n=1 Tax=Prevotella sp. khp7 TaxID=1761885 RepID=UPI0008CA5146|nr:hypothetical protein [Prevotella sp. khp7]SEW24646.1 hypothetical protein SAMN04487827_2307 [Prevotella sp. khp7]
MKKFIIKTAIFLAIITGIDIVAGVVFDYLRTHAEGGMTSRDNYICNELKTDILLCGSSRCVHHFNPQIITDSLEMSSYNSGQDGNGIILLYGRLQMIKQHMTPKLVIYDITPSFDLLQGEDNHRYLTWLKPYYAKKEIKEILLSVDSTERYKMLSSMYRYNSHIIEILIDFLRPIINAENNGFVPLLGKMDKSKIRRNDATHTPIDYDYDFLKLFYLEKYVEALGNNIVFCVSPIWYGMDTKQLSPVIKLCKKRGIEFIDFSNDPKYVRNDIYFKDGGHMNSLGADEFTKDLIKELRKRKVLE